MDLREYAHLRASGMEKTAIWGTLARVVPAAIRGIGGWFARKGAQKAVQTGVSAAAKKAPGLGSKIMSGINTASNVSMAKDLGESVFRRKQPKIGEV